MWPWNKKKPEVLTTPKEVLTPPKTEKKEPDNPLVARAKQIREIDEFDADNAAHREAIVWVFRTAAQYVRHIHHLNTDEPLGMGGDQYRKARIPVPDGADYASAEVNFSSHPFTKASMYIYYSSPSYSSSPYSSNPRREPGFSGSVFSVEYDPKIKVADVRPEDLLIRDFRAGSWIIALAERAWDAAEQHAQHEESCRRQKEKQEREARERFKRLD